MLTYGNLVAYSSVHLSSYLSHNLNILICNVFLCSTTTHLRLSEDPRVNRGVMLLLYFFYYDPVIFQAARQLVQVLYAQWTLISYRKWIREQTGILQHMRQVKRKEKSLEEDFYHSLCH